MRRVWPILSAGERGLSIAAISLMSLLPCIAMVTRLAGTAGISGSVVFVQQLTLCVAFLGAGLAASGDRLLSMSANTFLPEKWAGPVRVFACGLTAAIAAALCWASYQFVVLERSGGKELALGIKTWVPATVMPFGLLLVTIRAIRGAGPRAQQRLAAAAFLLVPLILGLAGSLKGMPFCGSASRWSSPEPYWVCQSSPLWAESRCCCSGVPDNPPPTCRITPTP